VNFEPSLSYTSVDIHTTSLHNKGDIPLINSNPLRPDTPITPPNTTTAKHQITPPPLSQQPAEYEQFSDQDSETA